MKIELRQNYMLLYSDFVEKVLKRLPEDMLVLLEKDGHITSPIWFDVEKLEYPDDIYCVKKGRQTVERFFELDEELFPEDMWEDHYRCASDYAEDWVQSEFEKFSRESQISVTRGMCNELTLVCNNAGIGYDNYGDCTVGMLIEDYMNYWKSLEPNNRLFLGYYELYFPHESDGISFKFTLLNGIGLNKMMIPQRPYIGIGKALIININPKMKDPKNEICDFSLFQNNYHQPWPRKYSPILYHSLISERRKTNEKD